MDMSPILFVQGAGSDQTVGDVYRYIKQYLPATYFRYDVADTLKHIHQQLKAVYLQVKPKIIISHSLGSVLVTNLLSVLDTCTTVILLMPFVSFDTGIAHYGTLVPEYFTNVCFYPAVCPVPIAIDYKCKDPLSRTRSDVCCVDLRQPFQAIKQFNLQANIEIYKRHHVTLVYGLQDQWAPLTPSALDILRPAVTLVPFDAGHTPFTDCAAVRDKFKTVLLDMLSSIHTRTRQTKTHRDQTPTPFKGFGFCYEF